ncbi:MAG TPA: cation acetate symporter, partial [Steroidobacteraceae bacterium]|nr:cation acetate symporter [Steroidobacteraceae bacterium]
RLKQKPIRLAAAIGGILVLLTYTIGQMVGAGNLIKLMFGLPYESAELIVGVVMLMYVLFGGMIATTWVQIIKAVLLLCGVTALMLIGMARFGFSPGALYGAVQEQYQATMLNPGGLVTNPIDAISLGLALMLGLLGLPHILMRFYTVPDAKSARKSVIWATSFIGYFYCIIPIVGFTAAVLVGKDIIGKVDAGGNMAAPLLAEFIGGTAFMGFIAAVAFATILAVVAGLTLAAASAMAHDLFLNVFRDGQAEEREQVKVARISTVVFGIAAILLGIAFKGQNVAYMVGLTFAIACSGNFPALLLSIIWRRFTTQGAVWAIIVGSLSATLLIVLSPTVWVDVFKYREAIFPLRNPAIVSMSLAFVVAVVFSLLSPDPEAEARYEDEKLRTYLGVGAE